MERLTVYTGCRYDTYDPIDTKYDFSEINLQKLIDKLAHYEDLAEAGRLVVLPEGIRQQDIWEPFMTLNCPSKFGLREKDHCVAGCGGCWEAALKGESE